MQKQKGLYWSCIKVGFDMQKLSIIGKDYRTTEHVRGFFTWKDTAKAGAAGGGYWGSFVGGLFGILAGAGVLFIPGMAPIVIAGPIAGILAGWLEGTLVGGAGAAAAGGLAGALSGLGIPKHEVLQYETQIQAGEFIRERREKVSSGRRSAIVNYLPRGVVALLTQKKVGFP